MSLDAFSARKGAVPSVLENVEESPSIEGQSSGSVLFSPVASAATVRVGGGLIGEMYAEPQYYTPPSAPPTLNDSPTISMYDELSRPPPLQLFPLEPTIVIPPGPKSAPILSSLDAEVPFPLDSSFSRSRAQTVPDTPPSFIPASAQLFGAVVVLYDATAVLPVSARFAGECANLSSAATPDEVCRFNARVAERGGRHDLVRIWSLAGLMMQRVSHPSVVAEVGSEGASGDVGMSKAVERVATTAGNFPSFRLHPRRRRLRQLHPETKVTTKGGDAGVAWREHPFGRGMARELLDYCEV